MRVNAILPAAGRISGDFAAEAGVELKALIELSGKTLLEHTIATLRATDCVDRIVVIGPEELTPAARGADIILPEGESGPDNIFRGLQWLHDSDGGHAERAMILTTDLPFLTPAAVTDFLAKCPEMDLCLPVIRREAFEARFPDMTIDYVRLCDGEWTMGCAFLINPTSLIKNRSLLDRVFVARKSQLAMARLLGPFFIARFICGRLTMADIEQRCLKLLGCSGAAVMGCAAELALDIDLPEEYRYAARNFADREPRPS